MLPFLHKHIFSGLYACFWFKDVPKIILMKEILQTQSFDANEWTKNIDCTLILLTALYFISFCNQTKRM